MNKTKFVSNLKTKHMKIKLKMTAILAFLILAACNDAASEIGEDEITDKETVTESATSSNEEAEVAQSTQTLNGIDISSHQGNEVETLNKNADDLSFVICRATDGITWQDPDFASNWELLAEEGFIKGAYHFYESDDDPESQIDNYLTTVGSLDANDLPPIVDFEGGGIDDGMSVEAVQENLLGVLQYLQEKTSRTPILYTNINDGNKYLSDSEFAAYTMWIADYSGGAEPTLPGAWEGSEWVLWQQTDAYVLDGQNNDFDLFNGNSAEFAKFIKNN